MLPDVRIDVTGMGGSINFEMMLIEKALRDAGFTNIEVINSAADWSVSKEAGWFEKVLAGSKKNEKIALVANHIPWGG